MDFPKLQLALDKLFSEFDFDAEYVKNNLMTDNFHRLNLENYYVTLHDLEKLKPIYINDLLRDYYGFEKNIFYEIDYFYYFLTLHPSKYGSLLESFMHFRKGGKGDLQLEYKLKNCNQKFENFIGCTHSIFVNQEPVMAVTLMSKTTGLSKKTSKNPTSVSSREWEIINLYCEGKTVKEVADKLYISEYTVKAHLKNIYRKLDIKNYRELLTYFETR